MNEQTDIQFQEGYENGLRRTYVMTPWPQRIEATKGLLGDAFYFDRKHLFINCANGSATYEEDGSDEQIWRGTLVDTSGENPKAVEVSS